MKDLARESMRWLLIGAIVSSVHVAHAAGLDRNRESPAILSAMDSAGYQLVGYEKLAQIRGTALGDDVLPPSVGAQGVRLTVVGAAPEVEAGTEGTGTGDGTAGGTVGSSTGTGDATVGGTADSGPGTGDGTVGGTADSGPGTGDGTVGGMADSGPGTGDATVGGTADSGPGTGDGTVGGTADSGPGTGDGTAGGTADSGPGTGDGTAGGTVVSTGVLVQDPTVSVQAPVPDIDVIVAPFAFGAF
jgi:hypothetical protein